MDQPEITAVRVSAPPAAVYTPPQVVELGRAQDITLARVLSSEYDPVEGKAYKPRRFIG
jgi:hypothetical protein